MQNALIKRYKLHCLASVGVLPPVVKSSFNVSSEFDISSISLSITDIGMKSPETFYRMYCDHCEKTILPNVLKNEKYGNFKTFEELVRNWDDCAIPDGLLDLVGCVFPMSHTFIVAQITRVLW